MAKVIVQISVDIEIDKDEYVDKVDFPEEIANAIETATKYQVVGSAWQATWEEKNYWC